MFRTASRVFRWTIALLLLSSAALVPAQAQTIGVAGGLNFNDLSDASISQEAPENATGYHVGLFADFGLGPVALRPGIFYTQTGRFDYDNLGANFPDNADDFQLNLVEVPVDVRLNVLPLPLVKPYVFAGPVLRFASADEDAFDEAVEDVSLAGNAGLGVEINVPVIGVTLFPEFRYAFGLTKVADFEALGTQFNTTDSPELNAYMIRLGIGF
ncbi:porin family protein [Salisaeta longa]|uniref:porin family protein n=1 Tax=Salisaeta longa TaxID=503170 RepID=UPI0003B7771F|nr:porin family protein [Salisaeta longa]